MGTVAGEKGRTSRAMQACHRGFNSWLVIMPASLLRSYCGPRRETARERLESQSVKKDAGIYRLDQRLPETFGDIALVLLTQNELWKTKINAQIELIS